jgi:hypothetical protein
MLNEELRVAKNLAIDAGMPAKSCWNTTAGPVV